MNSVSNDNSSARQSASHEANVQVCVGCEWDECNENRKLCVDSQWNKRKRRRQNMGKSISRYAL